MVGYLAVESAHSESSCDYDYHHVAVPTLYNVFRSFVTQVSHGVFHVIFSFQILSEYPSTQDVKIYQGKKEVPGLLVFSPKTCSLSLGGNY